MTLRQALSLYLVTDRAQLRGRSLTDVVDAAVRGGVSCVQLREKELDTRAFLAQARALKALLATRGVPLVINDRVDVALACDADGVHLGQRDMPPEDARRLLPPHVFIGLSVESMEDLRASVGSPIDYLGVSPVFASTTKLDTRGPWGLEGLRQLRATTQLPLVAIGGIDATRAGEVRAAGADGLAVVSAIMTAADPEAAAGQLTLPSR